MKFFLSFFLHSFTVFYFSAFSLSPILQGHKWREKKIKKRGKKEGKEVRLECSLSHVRMMSWRRSPYAIFFMNSYNNSNSNKTVLLGWQSSPRNQKYKIFGSVLEWAGSGLISFAPSSLSPIRETDRGYTQPLHGACLLSSSLFTHLYCGAVNFPITIKLSLFLLLFF